MQDPRRVDPALRKKYDVRGPRYTSYPPATHFHPIPEEELFSRWSARGGLQDDPGLSLYLHIPFCRTRCAFCGCHSVVTPGEDTVERYLRALVREMALASERIGGRRPVRQVALGGGTPNSLSEHQTDLLLSRLERTWQVEAGAERSVEIDPRTATPAKLDVFLDHGFNRFSLGVQDFAPEVLATIRRGQDLMRVEEVVSHLRLRGCQAINFDLIYGLPGQDLSSAAETARQVVRLRPSRVALYSYAHVPWLHPNQKLLERLGLPEPDLKMSLFLVMLDLLQEAGYVPVGMDHFALPDDSLARALESRSLRRNFMGYTTGRGSDLVAFGASAISSVGASYSQDRKGIDAYLEGIEAGRLPVERGFLLDRADEIRRELIIDLFCNFSVDLAALGARFGIDPAQFFADDLARLQPLAEDGLVTADARAVTVSETGRYFIRNVCMAFDRYLERDSSARMYSRTV
jgi:oxygen-independent coproporphyrinogen-3 oxidase